jgi:ferredoxin-NADP reductase
MIHSINWQIATISGIRVETPTVKTYSLTLPDWSPHRAGQHYDIRLTAADGYEAQRSYSIASPPEQHGTVELTVEKVGDGEVSGYLHDVAMTGDRIEVRGPIGGYFVWDAKNVEPLLLIAGGSGIVPLMAMLRHRAASANKASAVLLYSARHPDDLIYREELDAMAAAGDGLKVVYTLTRTQPPGWSGYARRIDTAMLAQVAGPLGRTPMAFICGPTLMVETAANGLIEIGVAASRIKTERFGPTA